MVTQSEEFKSLKKFAFSIFVVTAVDLVLKREAASDQVQAHMEKALKTSFDYLRSFLDLNIKASIDQKTLWEDTKETTDVVEAELGVLDALVGAADCEPRFSKCPFKATFCSELIVKIRALQSHVMCLVRRSQYPAPGIIDRLSKMKSFKKVKDDLMETLEDAEEVALTVLKYEGFGAMDPKDFKEILGKAGMESLDGVEKLIEEIKRTVRERDEPDDVSLEDSTLSRLCVVAEMLEVITRDVHAVLQVAVLNM